MDHGFGYEFGTEEEAGGDDGGAECGLAEDREHTVVALCAIVVSDDRLHTLVESHDNHTEDEGDPVDDAVGADGEVASVLEQLVIDDDDDGASCQVHEAGRESDSEHVGYDSFLEVEDVSLYSQFLFGSAEDSELPDDGDELCDYGSDGGTLYATMEDKDEDGVEYDIEDDGDDGGVHRFLRVSGGTEYAIESVVEVGEDIGTECDNHVTACEAECLVGSTETTQDRVEEDESDSAYDSTEYDIEHDDIAEHESCGLVVFLSESYGDECATADAYE